MSRAVRLSELCTFTDKQREATKVADAHKYTLYGGSRGPGKSHWLRWYPIRRLLRWAAQGHEQVRVGMFCEDYPSLLDRQISKLARLPQWLGEVTTTKTDGLGFFLKPEYGGGAILLRNLKDTTRYQSAEFAGISIDELTRNPLRAFNELRGSLRWPGIDDTYFVAASNPNGRYFKWVRRLWIERDFSGDLAHLELVADQFAYVQALPGDNPYLSDDYWHMLNSLPGRLREAWRDGSWYVAVEGLVYDTFTEGNITDLEPNLDRPIELAIDDGYNDPRATLFVQRREDGGPLVFDELYHTKHLEEQTIRKVFRKLYEHDRRLRPERELENGKPVEDWPDDASSMPIEQLARWAKEQGMPVVDIAAVSHEAVALRRRLRGADIPARNWLSRKAGAGKSTRKEAIKLTRGLICDGNGHRSLLVNARCRNLLDEMTAGYRNREGADGFEDEPEDGNDHAAQALESWVWLRMGRG